MTAKPLSAPDSFTRSGDRDKFVVRLPDGMRDRLASAAKTAGRSANAEIIHRLEQSFTALPSIVAQHELALPLPAAVQADQLTAARHVFESVLAVAERMRIDRHTAIARALQSALKRTGVDLAQELDVPVATGRPAPRAALEVGEAQRLRAFLQGRESVRADHVCREALGHDPSDRGTRMRLSNVMRSMGWTGTRRRIGGARTRVYLPPRQEG